jgi:hypothetical protein
MSNHLALPLRVIRMALVAALFVPAFVAAQSSRAVSSADTKAAKGNTKPASTEGLTVPRTPICTDIGPARPSYPWNGRPNMLGESS